MSAAISDFFLTLYPDFDHLRSVIEIRGIDKQKVIKRYFCSNLAEIHEAVDLLSAENSYDIYFECPELKAGSKSGKEERVWQYPFLYADMDPKVKDVKGNVIKTFSREELRAKIKAFPLPPTFIVDSGYGFHLYWKLSTPLRSSEEARVMLTGLSLALGSDVKGSLTTQILRVPGTLNRKNDTETPVRIIMQTSNTYSKNEFLKHVDMKRTNELLEEKTKRPKREQKVYIHKNGISFTFSTKPTPLEIETDDFSEVISLIRKQNPFLASNQPNFKLADTFCCLFHRDQHPSANIYKDKNGHYFYKCFAASHQEGDCSAVHLDLIHICQLARKMSFAQSILFLCDFFGIRFLKRQWFWDQLEKYQRNAMFLEQFEELGYNESYPHLYKKIKNRIPYLKMINHYALAKISSDKYQFQGDNIFFFSYEYFAAANKLNEQTVRNNLNTLCTLGLVRKLDLDDVPAELAQTAIHYQQQETKRRTGRAQVNPINFYTLPSLFDVSMQAEEIAKQLTHFNMRNCMNKTFLLTRFGEDTANKVYHDERIVSKTSETIAKRLEKTMCELLAKQGYTTKSQILAKTKLEGRLRATQKQKEQELDRNFSNFLDKYDLQVVRAGRALQQRYRLRKMIAIIVPNQNSSPSNLS